MLSDRLCVKYGRRVHLSEAATMRFISQYTSIPVPRVLCAFTRNGWTYIVIERIRGHMIGSGRVKRSEEPKTKLLAQLKEMICELRELKPPETMGVASVDGGSLYDCRIPGPSIRFGPFDTTQDFHRYLRMGREFDSRHDSDIQDLIKQQSKSWPLVFYHSDLSSLNILARGDNIVGIIDWETAGWYPHTGNILLPAKSTHKTHFGSMRLINSYYQCRRSWRWKKSVKNTLEMFE